MPSNKVAVSNILPIRIGYLMVLITLGAQTMIVELSIPRMLAPQFGDTLFCWTAIISVVLLALSIGYYLGGVVAVSWRNRGAIAMFALLSAAWVIGLSIFGDRTISPLSGLGLMTGPLAGALVLAAVPTACSATVVPLIVHFWSDDAAKSAGVCYAWSTVGSILGALATGYILLPLLGISGTLLIAGSLVVLSLLAAGFFRYAAAGVLFLLLGAFQSHALKPGILFDKSNNYHRIRIVSPLDRPAVRELLLDSTIEGAVVLGSTYPPLYYQAEIKELAAAVPGLSRALFIGGGSFSMPRYLHALFPKTTVDAVEIDPDVIAAARKYLQLGNDINVYQNDGRIFIRNVHRKYDIIVNDAFHGVRSIPFYLLTKEFDILLQSRLFDSGLYAINIIGHPSESRLVKAVTGTLMVTFKYVNLWYRQSGTTDQNIWVLAGNRRIALGKPAGIRNPAGNEILTDNRAPVDYLIAWELLRK